jgi:O-antigen/teichoic acid export membrane protein
VSRRRWATQGAYSLLDQGSLSGANFTLGVCYARWLAPDQYGVFSILLAVFLFLAGFHNAILLEPMSVLGPGKVREARGRYLASLFLAQAGLTAILALMAFIAGSFFLVAKESLGRGLEAVGLSLPPILLFWLLRRACYLANDAGRAAGSSLCYAGCLLVATHLSKGSASPSVGVISMGAASAVASIVAFRAPDLSWRKVPLRETVREHWRYGRWALGVSLLFWLTGPFFAPVLGYFGGLSDVATLRAAENLLSPLGQVVAALSLLTLPWLAGQATRDGGARLRGLAVRISFAGLVLSSFYAVALLGVSGFLISRLYAGHTYDRAVAVLPLLCLASVVRFGADLGVGLSLKAASRPDGTFWAAATAAACSVTIGVGLVRAYGLAGAAWGALLTGGVQAVVLVWRFAGLPAPGSLDQSSADLPAAQARGAF